MNKRIQMLKEMVRPGKYQICTEKMRLITESFQKTERQPEILRNAAAFAHILDNITIFIENGELIVGNAASKPRGIEFTNLWGIWNNEEMYAQGIKSGEGLTISAGTKLNLKKQANIGAARLFCRDGHNLLDDERLWPFAMLGVDLPPWKGRREVGRGRRSGRRRV